jgi:filamentous hemagglutinin family protein
MMKSKKRYIYNKSDLLRGVVTWLYIAHTGLYSPLTMAQDLTLPTQGVVRQGQVTIEQTAGAMQINQLSTRSVINWQTFNVGKDAVVNFKQPSSSAVTLNRVTGNTPSQILGSVNANGQVFLVNSSGVYFGGGAHVNVGALVASTQSISDGQFISGQYEFVQNQSGVIINNGAISGGYLALIAPQITNTGTLSATRGDAVLASGQNVALNISPSGRIKVSMSDSEAQSLITNSGSVEAQQTVQFKANAVQTVIDQSIKTPSSIDQLVTTNGVVRMVRSSGTIKGQDVTISAGSGSANIDGAIDVSQTNSKAGSISISGVETEIGANAFLNAQGTLGGGNIWVGGEWQGQGEMQQAVYTTIAPGAVLDASATVYGDGGTIVAWSDITNPLSKTYANGKFQALGGVNGGDGGQIETSGYFLNVDNIAINTQSFGGNNGLWLLDPFDITIGDTASGTAYANSFVADEASFIQASTVASALNAGTNVSISTGDQSANTISINSAITKTTGAAAALHFTGGTINVNADIVSSFNALDLTFNGDAINLGANLTTNGGDILMYGSSLAATTIAVTDAIILTNGGNLTLKANTMTFTDTSANYYDINLMQTADIMDENGDGGTLTIENGVGSSIYLDSFIEERTSISDVDPFFFILAADLAKNGAGTVYLNPGRHVLPNALSYPGPLGSIEVMHDINVNAGRVILDYTLYNNNAFNNDIAVAAGATFDFWGNATAFSPYLGTNDALFYAGYDQSYISYFGNISGGGDFKLSNCGTSGECRTPGTTTSGGTFALTHSKQSGFSGTLTIDSESTLRIFAELGNTHSSSPTEQIMVGPILSADNNYLHYWSTSNYDGMSAGDVTPLGGGEVLHTRNNLTLDTTLGQDLDLRSMNPDDDYYANSVNFVVNGTLKNYAYNFLLRAGGSSYAPALANGKFPKGTIFTGVISGNGTIINDYANTMVITNPNNTFTGDLSIQNGTVMLAGGGVLNSTGTYDGFIYNDGILAFNESWSANQTLTGGMSGIGTLFKAGDGTLTLASTTKAYSGGTYVLPPKVVRNGSADLIVSTGATLGSGAVNLFDGALLSDTSGSTVTNKTTPYYFDYIFADNTNSAYAGIESSYTTDYLQSTEIALRYLHITQSSDTANEVGLLNEASVAWLSAYGYDQGIGARSQLGEYDATTDAAQQNKQDEQTKKSEAYAATMDKIGTRQAAYEAAVEEKIRSEPEESVNLEDNC